MKKVDLVKALFRKLHGVEGEVTAAKIKKVYSAYDSTVTWGELGRWLINEEFALVPSATPAMPPASTKYALTQNEHYRLLVEAIKPLEEIQGFTAENLTAYDNGGCDVNMYKYSTLVGNIGYSAVHEKWFFEKAIHNEQTYSLAEPKYNTRINGCITELLNSDAHYKVKSQSTKNYSIVITECITRVMKMQDYDITKVQFLRFGNLAEETVKTMYNGKTLGNITYMYKTGEWFFSSDNYQLPINYRVTVKGAVADLLNHHKAHG